jgi:cell division transport system permease protein
MMAVLRQHCAALHDALRRVGDSPLGTLLNVAAIGTALSLPLALFLALDHLSGVGRHFSRNPQVSIFLSLDTVSDDVRRIEQRLRQHPAVVDVQFLPRDQALDSLERIAGLGDVHATLGHNPLPEAFVATVRAEAPHAAATLREEVARWPKVEHAQGETLWAERLQALLTLGRALVLVLAVLLGASLVAVTFNTIRLQILARKEEIEVSKLIGATDGFVHRPFLYLGLLQGLGAAAFALLVVLAALMAVAGELEAISALYAGSVRLVRPTGLQTIAVLGGGAVLGALGSWLAVHKHLKTMALNT